MANPRSMIPAYPTKEIQDKLKEYSRVHVYLDVKNAMTALFIPDVALSLVETTERYGTLDSSIFQAILTYSSYWKSLCAENGVECKIFASTDVGTSEYHRSIHKEYKSSRNISKDGGARDKIDEQLKEIRDVDILFIKIPKIIRFKPIIKNPKINRFF